MASVYSLALSGFVLGWSVAWPPGPINAEAIRRGLARRLWPAYAVVLGGCVGDALWAVVVGLGAGALLLAANLEVALGIVSTALLLVLAAMFFRGAWKRFRSDTAPAPSMFDSTRGSFTLGLTLALTGPWNIAFWLAVIGQYGGVGQGFVDTVVIACGVVAGAASWGLILCVAVTKFGARFAKPSWDIATHVITGALMVFFAVRTAVQLIGA